MYIAYIYKYSCIKDTFYFYISNTYVYTVWYNDTRMHVRDSLYDVSI